MTREWLYLVSYIAFIDIKTANCIVTIDLKHRLEVNFVNSEDGNLSDDHYEVIANEIAENIVNLD